MALPNAIAQVIHIRPRCPRCGKKFSSEQSVERHLVQPNSTCARLPRVLYTYEEDLIGDIGRYGINNFEAGRNIEVDGVGEFGECDGLGDGGLGDGGLGDGGLGDGGLGDGGLGDGGLGDGGFGVDVDRDNVNHVEIIHTDGSPYMDIFPRPSATYGKGDTFMDIFDKDSFSQIRQTNLFYPFASRMDWQFGSLLHKSGLSMTKTDELLSAEVIQNSGISFSNARELRGRIELLPAGSKWKYRTIDSAHPTKSEVCLYFRDAKECIASLFGNPLHADHLEYNAYKVFKDVERTVRLYTEWLSARVAWNLQGSLPLGSTLLGVILSSDKTTISVMTGNRVAYPLLLSLANIRQAYRLKSSHGTFILLALLPVAKFIHPDSRIRSLLQDRLIHECLDIVLEPLKKLAVEGAIMVDPLGRRRKCYTMLASYTVDTPEAQLLACVGGKTSPVTMAYYKQFGDNYRHGPRSGTNTKDQIQKCESIVAPEFLEGFLWEAQGYRLNGVHKPFWRNWKHADPCIFLTPEPLHHWHKQFWDHDARWCINIIGSPFIDFLFSLLHIRTGYRQFCEGISKLKQVTGRTHREVQRYIIPVIALIADWRVVFALRSLMDFRYFGQSPAPSDDTLRLLLLSLSNFHRYKDIIIEAGGRLGAKGNVIFNFFIPKLELYQSVVFNIIANGSAAQYTADITEHCHITEVKEPARLGNNQNYDQQIVRALDREDRRSRFDLATSMRAAGVDMREADNSDEDDIEEEDITRLSKSSDLLSSIDPVSRVSSGPRRTKTDYFKKAQNLEEDGDAPAASIRTFVHNGVAFNLSRDPTISHKQTVDQTSNLFSLPDFHQALGEYIHHIKTNGDVVRKIGGRRIRLNEDQMESFNFLQVWCRLRYQTKAYHYPHDILEAETINCYHSSPKYPRGLYDYVLVNTDANCIWPSSKLNGHSVVQIRFIFRILPLRHHRLPSGLDGFLAYVQRFDVQNQTQSDGQTLGMAPNAVTGMYSLRRSIRSDGTPQGGIVQVRHICTPISLIPHFRNNVDRRLNKDNCMESYTDFWLNDYFDKEIFFALRS